MTKTPSLAGSDAECRKQDGSTGGHGAESCSWWSSKEPVMCIGAAGSDTPSDLMRICTEPGCSLKKHKVRPGTSANLRLLLGDGTDLEELLEPLRLCLNQEPRMKRAAGAPQPSLTSPSSGGSARDRPCPLLLEQHTNCQLFQTNPLSCPRPVCRIC